MDILKNTGRIAGVVAFGLWSGVSIAESLPGGASSLTESYENWELTCVNQDETPVCSLAQVQINAETQQQMLAIELRPDGAGGLSGVMVLPFGLALSQGIAIGIDDQEANATLGFTTCLPVGCLVPVGFDAGSIASLATANQLTATAIISDSGDPISFVISLTGLQNAHARLQDVLRN